ncbi:MAG TPA: response regulator, partial [Kofleriaceae bacterium]
MRSFDWSRTPLGPVVHWPQSLRTAVSIMLDSAFAMVVAWGPEFVFLYNDRYRPVLGATKHPGALGKAAKDIFPEAWGFLGPLFENTRNGEAVALDDILIPLERNGYLEDCYFTLSYSAIRDESGGVGGMLAVVAETTERVRGERRMVTLRDLAALGDARNADDACRRAETVLAGNPVDVPFSLLYLLQPERRGARLAAATGVMKHAAAAPGEIVLDDARWPLGEAYRERRTIVVDDLRARFGAMPGGPYPQPAHTALVLPMPRAGHDEPHGFFVAGVSPRRALDDRYRTFFELARDHLVAALDKALAFEDSRKRTEALAEIDRAKTALFSNISHEFRTPLTLMLGLLEDALARGSITPDDLGTAFRDPAEEAVAVSPAERAEPAPAPRARVLVADDNADMRSYLRGVLAPHVAVDTACDGRAALEAARCAPPDLVLTDVMMPNLDGFGLMRALRADERTRAIPVVLLSARAGDESRIEGLQAGADDYLVKPFSARELIARVRTHLELSRLRREAELQSSRLNTLFEHAPAAICVLEGPDHVYRLMNPPCLEAIGHRPVIGQTIRQAMPELEGQGIVEMLDRVYATGEQYIDSEVPIRLQRGAQLEQTYWNVVFQPYRDAEGNVEGVMTFGFEITMQVRARQRAEALTRQLQASEAKAEAANRAKDEFLAVLGHELRNPLAPILTALQLMRLRGGDTGARERSIIERQAQHLVRLVDDLLDVSRITRGKIELKTKRVELGDVVARAIEMTSPVLEQRQHRLGLHVPPCGLAVDGDPDRLAQIFSNLLTNAAKYTERGGRITVSAERCDDRIGIRVKDTGIGIAPEMLPRVFEMFVQEQQALDRSRGGLGLGLTIVRSLVAMHGGTVEVHSEGRNRGSEFVVLLPAAGVRPPGGADEAAAPNGARRGAGAGRRILVVDDNEDAAELLASALEVMGHTTRVAHDGPEALKAGAEFDPDLALLDIGLPVM